MNTLLSMLLLVLLLLNNNWRVALQPSIKIQTQKKDAVLQAAGSLNASAVQATHSLAVTLMALLLLVASYLYAQSSGYSAAWSCMAIVISLFFAHVSTSSEATGIALLVCLVPPAIRVAYFIFEKDSSEKLGKGSSGFVTDSFAWLFMVSTFMNSLLLSPAAVLNIEAAHRATLGSSGLQQNGANMPPTSGSISNSREAGQAEPAMDENAHEAARETNVAKGTARAQPRGSAVLGEVWNLGAWGGMLALGFVGIVVASLASTIQNSLWKDDRQERKVLRGINKKGWTNFGNWRLGRSDSFCVWGGVACYTATKGIHKTNRVKFLNLPFSGVTGNFPFEKLAHLRVVNLTFSYLDGEISADVCHLKDVEYLGYSCGQTLPSCAQELCTNTSCLGGGGNLSLGALLNLPNRTGAYTQRQSCLYYSHRKPILLDGDLKLNASIDIYAQTNAVIDGGGYTLTGAAGVGALFRVHDGGSLELRNLVLEGAFGYAIYFDSSRHSLELKNCTFSRSNGTAVFVKTAESVSIQGSAFYYNKNGAVRVMDSTLDVDSSSFKWNVASGDGTWPDACGGGGGAICANGHHLNVISSSFYGNAAPFGAGGAIYVVGSYTAFISQCNFKGNRASASGGAIYNKRLAFVTSSQFYENRASNGGAIYNHRTMKVRTTYFGENNASVYGGAIYNRYNLHVTGSVFGSNEARIGARICNAEGARPWKKGAMLNRNRVKLRVKSTGIDANNTLQCGMPNFHLGEDYSCTSARQFLGTHKTAPAYRRKLQKNWVGF